MVGNFPKAGVCFLGLLLLAGCAGRGRVSSPQVALAPHQILVARGDTLSALAYRHGVLTSSLIEANHLKPPYRIYPGQILTLPVQEEGPVARVPQPSASGEPSFAEEGGGAPLSIHKSLDPLPRVGPSSGESLEFDEKKQDNEQDKVFSGKTDLKRRAVLDPDIERELDLEQERSSKRKPPRRASPLPQPVGRSSPSLKGLKASVRFPWPVKGQIIEKYGRGLGKGGSDGIRIAAPVGTPVRSIQKGKVIYAGNEIPKFGHLILIDHQNTWISAYGCVKKILVKKDQFVEKGDIIAEVGATGDVKESQLYFELRGRDKNPVDPEAYLGS